MLGGRLLFEESSGTSRVAGLLAHRPHTRNEGAGRNVVNANSFEFAFPEIELLR